jgi:hypothetical protein
VAVIEVVDMNALKLSDREPPDLLRDQRTETDGEM